MIFLVILFIFALGWLTIWGMNGFLLPTINVHSVAVFMVWFLSIFLVTILGTLFFAVWQDERENRKYN